MTTNLVEADGISIVTGQSRLAHGRLRVLHLLHSFDIGGTERQAIELLKWIDAKRYDIRLAVLRRQGPLYAEIADRFPAIPEYPLTSFYNPNALRQLRRLCALLSTERINIIHTHDFYSGMLGAVAGRLTKTLVIAGQRNLRQSDRLVHQLGQRFIVKLAHRVLVNAEAIRDQILRAGSAPAEKLVVIKNGCRITEPLLGDATIHADRRTSHDALCRELRIDTSARLIGIVANLRPVKGHCHLIEAAPRIIQNHPSAHFVLVGGGELRKDLENQAARLGVRAHVHFVGWRADAARLNSAFDLALLTSLHEGLPNSVMEAMAAGTPVVATAVGGVRELIADGQTGFLVSAGDAADLANSICRALANEHESLAIGIRGRDFVVARFSMQRMVTETQDLYDALAAEYSVES